MGESTENKVKLQEIEVPLDRANELRETISLLSPSMCVEVLVNACFKYDDILQFVRFKLNQSSTYRRLMIRNVSFMSTSEGLLNVFEPFGEVEEGAIVTERGSGQSRGFAFVTYKDMEAAKRAMKAKIYLDNRLLLVKLATESPGSAPQVTNVFERKLFVRNLSDDTMCDDLRGMMGKHGPLEECVVISDHEGRSKGYAFVTYADADSANRALQEPQRILKNRMVFISLAAAGGRQGPSATTPLPNLKRPVNYDQGPWYEGDKRQRMNPSAYEARMGMGGFGGMRGMRNNDMGFNPMGSMTQYGRPDMGGSGLDATSHHPGYQYPGNMQNPYHYG